MSSLGMGTAETPLISPCYICTESLFGEAGLNTADVPPADHTSFVFTYTSALLCLAGHLADGCVFGTISVL